MPYIIGRRADKRFVRYTSDFHRVVRYKAVTALYKLDCGFAFTYSAFTQQQYSLTVNLHQNAVARNARRKAQVQKRY